jgi:Zn-dependent peptidase ImmA (M78 family)
MVNLGHPVDDVAAGIRTWIGVPLEDQRQWRRGYDALRGWIKTLEGRGILVFQTGDVTLDEMRGFSLSEPVLPAVVLNGKDSPRARVFTLMHELTHLGLRQSGLCNPTRAAPGARTDDQAVETYCNRVAGAILVPTDSMREHPAVRDAVGQRDWEERTISDIAEHFGVSREVILFRLLSLNLTSQGFVSRKLDQYDEQYRRRRAEPSVGFLPFHRRVIRDNGVLFTRLVLNALEREQITPADFSDFLGVQLKHLDRIADEVEDIPITQP